MGFEQLKIWYNVLREKLELMNWLLTMFKKRIWWAIESWKRFSVAPLSKKGHNNHKKFKPHKKKNHSNTFNPSSSPNGPNKGIKKQGSCHFCKRKGQYKTNWYKFKAWMNYTNKQDNSCMFWILFSWCSIKNLEDWCWDMHTYHNFITRFLKKRRPNQGEVDLFVANKEIVKV